MSWHSGVDLNIETCIIQLDHEPTIAYIHKHLIIEMTGCGGEREPLPKLSTETMATRGKTSKRKQQDGMNASAA
jgi:hypothetical protein